MSSFYFLNPLCQPGPEECIAAAGFCPRGGMLPVGALLGAGAVAAVLARGYEVHGVGNWWVLKETGVWKKERLSETLVGGLLLAPALGFGAARVWGVSV